MGHLHLHPAHALCACSLICTHRAALLDRSAASHPYPITALASSALVQLRRSPGRNDRLVSGSSRTGPPACLLPPDGWEQQEHHCIYPHGVTGFRIPVSLKPESDISASRFRKRAIPPRPAPWRRPIMYPLPCLTSALGSGTSDPRAVSPSISRSVIAQAPASF